MLEIEYLEFYLTDENVSNGDVEDEVVYEKNDATIEKIEYLSNLSEKKLEAVVNETIDGVVDKAMKNKNIVILPSSYSVLEKYGYNEEVIDSLKTEKKKLSGVGTPIESNAVVAKVSHKGFEKTATGYLKNGSGTKLATYKMTIQWWRNTSNQIYYWDVYNKSTASSKYKHIKHIHKYARTENSKKVLAVYRISKFKKTLYVPGLVPAYNNIHIWADCFRGGNIDTWYDTTATYN